MKTKIYRVKGTLLDSDKAKPFTREMKAIKEEDIKEKLYSEFGSKHRLNRDQIIFEEIAEIAPEDVKDPIVQNLL
ncbi:MAG: 50S ribosomal protein L18Ae [Methanosphaera sp.]|uniref:50S ribosomal protein L18Ae n=1 Tax=Methanosphaera sp. TaxID=2666342 RepID=UPI0025D9EEEE|nr:50S ribosomal protein L18Ae [Methanosphaera sp.]MCI5867864.1 50S ribosomal protein L18Ae [Methanosphaera sp.]MDY3955334.1 50S ribosomal protein L18Ae [Methanosphaera sp.]